MLELLDRIGGLMLGFVVLGGVAVFLTIGLFKAVGRVLPSGIRPMFTKLEGEDDLELGFPFFLVYPGFIVFGSIWLTLNILIFGYLKGEFTISDGYNRVVGFFTDLALNPFFSKLVSVATGIVTLATSISGCIQLVGYIKLYIDKRKQQDR